MDTKKFLQLVVPDKGHICIADHITFDDGKKAFVHYPFADHGKAAQFAEWLDGKGSTIYYALATYAETFTNKNGKERLKRTQKNVAFLKSIWLDIDYKDCPKEELVPKLGAFIQKTGLPKPSMIVDSGGGLHIYWCLQDVITPDLWVPLAEGLKKLCKDHDLPADHVCTSDMARVLRPIGTTNRKYDPERKVKLVAGAGNEYEYETLLAPMPSISTEDLPAHLKGKATGSGEYSNTGFAPREVDTAAVLKKCAVLRHTLQTGGKYCSEPEWNAILLTLRFLPEGAKLVHPMSKGHIDYNPDDTMEKWQQKLEADVTGPPLCDTLEQYGHTDKCKTCPIYKSKKYKTPLGLGYVSDQPTEKSSKKLQPNTGHFVSTPTHDFPNGWRPIPGNEGVEKKYYDKDAGEWAWEPVLKRTWRIKEAQKSITTGVSSILVEAAQVTGRRIEIDVPGSMIGGGPELIKLLGEKGAPLLHGERKWWSELMTTWLAKLQQENAELDTVERFGWLRDPDPESNAITGFSAGRKTFMVDGTDLDTMRIRAEYEQIGRLYVPHGKLEEWQKAARYITDQNNPTFTTLLASAFAAPLIPFADIPGAILSFVSNESGIGKTSAMRVAQAVWGHPQKAMSSTEDTPLSITKKIGFLNNLPAYWDELRGEKALNGFYQVAFDVAQGKEKTRLDQSARMREINDWQTIMIAASNQSLFDLMAQKGGHSDASIARTFEITVDAAQITPDLDAQPLFGALNYNFGHAGQIYAKHLARNHKKIEKRMAKMLAETRSWATSGRDRFWAAIAAVLVVAAVEANECGVTEIDVKTMFQFLQNSFLKLRVRSGAVMQNTSARELVIDYTQQFQDGGMTIDAFPLPRAKNYNPTILVPAKARLQYVKAGEVYRFRRADFSTWLRQSKGLQFSAIEHELISELGMTEINTELGLGTPKALGKSAVIEVFLGVDDD